MEEGRFDSISMSVGRSASRRGAVRALLGGIVGLGGVALGVNEAIACSSKRKKCRRHKQCCSEKCKGRRARKRCRCSPRNWWCNKPSDCCERGSGCVGYAECYGGKVCCRPRGAPCRQACDCCGANDYCDTGQCLPRNSGTCSEPGSCHIGGFPNCGGTSACACAREFFPGGPVCVNRADEYVYCTSNQGCSECYEHEHCIVNVGPCVCSSGYACAVPCGASGTSAAKQSGDAARRPEHGRGSTRLPVLLPGERRE